MAGVVAEVAGEGGEDGGAAFLLADAGPVFGFAAFDKAQEYAAVLARRGGVKGDMHGRFVAGGLAGEAAFAPEGLLIDGEALDDMDQMETSRRSARAYICLWPGPIHWPLAGC